MKNQYQDKTKIHQFHPSLSHLQFTQEHNSFNFPTERCTELTLEFPDIYAQVLKIQSVLLCLRSNLENHILYYF